MDSLNIIIHNLDSLADTVKAINDTSFMSDSISQFDNTSNVSIEIIDFVKSILFIFIGAFISKLFLDIRNHRRLYKLYDYLNIVFRSLIKRVDQYAKNYDELVVKLNDPKNKDFIPPSSPGVETEIINSIAKEDLFEIFLVRLKSNDTASAKKDFLFLMNSIKYFESIFSNVQEESKSTVESIASCVERMVELHLQLTQDVTTYQFEAKGSDIFVFQISKIWESFIKKNNGLEINDFQEYEKNLIDELDKVGKNFANNKKDIRAYKLVMLLWRIKQELGTFRVRKNSLIEYLTKYTKDLKSESEKFLDAAERFNKFTFKKWIAVGFDRKQRDKEVFKELREKKETTHNNTSA